MRIKFISISIIPHDRIGLKKASGTYTSIVRYSVGQICEKLVGSLQSKVLHSLYVQPANSLEKITAAVTECRASFADFKNGVKILFSEQLVLIRLWIKLLIGSVLIC